MLGLTHPSTSIHWAVQVQAYTGLSKYKHTQEIDSHVQQRDSHIHLDRLISLSKQTHQRLNQTHPCLSKYTHTYTCTYSRDVGSEYLGGSGQD